MSIDLTDSIKVQAQEPLDIKTQVATLAEISTLGTGDAKAYTYHKNMIINCAQDNKNYKWTEVDGSFDPAGGLLATNFTYPNGITVNGIVYSNAIYNLVEVEVSGTVQDASEVALTTAVNGQTDVQGSLEDHETRLSGIDANATDDQTGAEIKTAYETELNTNAFTDAEKSKLATLEEKFQGKFVNLTALQASTTPTTEGMYGWVDAGLGSDVQEYIYDIDDAAWVLVEGAGTTETAASVKIKYESNADTNVFDDAEKAKLATIEADADVNRTATEQIADFDVILGTDWKNNAPASTPQEIYLKSVSDILDSAHLGEITNDAGDITPGLWVACGDSKIDGRQILYHGGLLLDGVNMVLTDHGYSNNSMLYWSTPANVQKSVTAVLSAISDYETSYGIAAGTGENIIVSLHFGTNMAVGTTIAQYVGYIQAGTDHILAAKPNVKFVLAGATKSHDDVKAGVANDAYQQVGADATRAFSYIDNFTQSEKTHPISPALFNNYWADITHESYFGGIRQFINTIHGVSSEMVKNRIEIGYMVINPGVEDDVTLLDPNDYRIDTPTAGMLSSGLIAIPRGGFRFIFDDTGSHASDIRRLRFYDVNGDAGFLVQRDFQAGVGGAWDWVSGEKTEKNAAFIEMIFTTDETNYDPNTRLPDLRFFTDEGVTRNLSMQETLRYMDVRFHTDYNSSGAIIVEIPASNPPVTTTDALGDFTQGVLTNSTDITSNDTAAAGRAINQASIVLRESLAVPAEIAFGNTLTITGEGTFTAIAGGLIEITPDAAYTGATAFQYKVADDLGSYSDWEGRNINCSGSFRQHNTHSWSGVGSMDGNYS